MHLSAINIFPIKSLAGISLDSAKVAARGLQHDRRWMLVDENGRFQSQREFPKMALLGTEIKHGNLHVFDRKNPSERMEISLDLDLNGMPLVPVSVWDSDFYAYRLSDRVGEWFADQLGKHLHLVYMPDSIFRPTNPVYAEGFQVSFADGYPVLLVGQASLDDLNGRLAQPIPMNRFRPNLVFTGGRPYEEDTFWEVQIGAAMFRGVKPCGRCTITTTDQDSSERSAERLKTLAKYRSAGKNINFGENLVWVSEESPAFVRVGDAVKVYTRKTAITPVP